MRGDSATICILDRGVSLNLCVIEKLDEVLTGLPYKCAVVPESADVVYHLTSLGDAQEPSQDLTEDADKTGRLVSLRPLVDSGIIRVQPETSMEYFDLVTELSRSFSGISAKVFALARIFGSTVATDDSVTQRLAMNFLPEVPLVTTTELIRTWAMTHQIPSVDVEAVVRQIASRAHFIPNASDPQFAWWNKFMV